MQVGHGADNWVVGNRAVLAPQLLGRGLLRKAGHQENFVGQSYIEI